MEKQEPQRLPVASGLGPGPGRCSEEPGLRRLGPKQDGFRKPGKAKASTVGVGEGPVSPALSDDPVDTALSRVVRANAHQASNLKGLRKGPGMGPGDSAGRGLTIHWAGGTHKPSPYRWEGDS